MTRPSSNKKSGLVRMTGTLGKLLFYQKKDTQFETVEIFKISGKAVRDGVGIFRTAKAGKR